MVYSKVTLYAPLAALSEKGQSNSGRIRVDM